jgi:hypothetical protein
METAETKIMRAKIEQQRAADHVAVDQKHNASLAALEAFEKTIQPGRTTMERVKLRPLVWRGLRPAIREAIDTLDGEFTIEDIVKALGKYPDKPEIEKGALSVELWWACKEKNIELVRKGRPNVYKKAEVQQ